MAQNEFSIGSIAKAREARIDELEKQLQDALVTVACVVEAVGGQVTVPDEILRRVSLVGPGAWALAAREEIPGGVTFTVLRPQGPDGAGDVPD